jgi:hypothetical protein
MGGIELILIGVWGEGILTGKRRKSAKEFSHL